MPETCFQCMTSDLRTAVRCDQWSETGKAPSCPIQEIPEKHGQLIDVDELVQTLDSAINLMESMLDLLELDADDGCLIELKAYRDIRDGIKELDAILEAERVEE